MIESIRDSLYNFERSIEGLIKILTMSSFKTNVKNGEKKGKSCVIFGNGPSLNTLLKEHSDFLNGKDIMSVNFFPNADMYSVVKSNIHLISAPDFWRYDSKPIYFNLRMKFFNDLAQKTTWPVDFYIPTAAKKFPEWQNTIKQNKYITPLYYNYTPIEGFPYFSFWAYRKNLGMPRPHNVLVPAIMIAINLGYSEIYLWGADHSWLPLITVDENNHALINNQHFYDENTSKPEKMNKPGSEYRKLHEILKKLMYSFESYFVIKKYAERQGVKVLNATPKSFIDAFDRFCL
jgi:hypothetical protein